MLRLNPQKRAKCDEIRDIFQERYDNCQDPDYCRSKRTNRPPLRKATDLSLLEPEIVDKSTDRCGSESQGPQEPFLGRGPPTDESTFVGTQQEYTPDDNCGSPLIKSHTADSSTNPELDEEIDGGHNTNGAPMMTSPYMLSEQSEALENDNKPFLEHLETRQTPSTAHSTIVLSNSVESSLDDDTPRISTDPLPEGGGPEYQEGPRGDRSKSGPRPPEKAPGHQIRHSAQGALLTVQVSDTGGVSLRERGILRGLFTFLFCNWH